MSKIAIDLGHGVGQDRGAVGCIQEEEIINEVGARVINKLKTLGHTVIETRPISCTGLSDSLYKRVNKANANNVDLFVSIHANAGGGKGTEVFTYNGNKFSQAVNVLNNICALGFRNRGIKPSNEVAYVVNHTNAKAMLIETCFVDTQSDVDNYRKVGPEAIANAIVKGLVGKTIQASTGNVNSKPITNTSNVSTHLRDWQQAYNDTYRGIISVDGIFGPQTEQALKTVLIKTGSSNALVGWLQCRIGADVDNKFGANTKAKLIEFQKANSLDPDGIAGYNTFKKLLEKFNW